MITLDPAHVALLRSALDVARFRVDDVTALLGRETHRALLRNESVPALRATADGSPLSTPTPSDSATWTYDRDPGGRRSGVRGRVIGATLSALRESVTV